jgi:hypothetical protein
MTLQNNNASDAPDAASYDDSDWTEDEMIELAANMFADLDSRGPIA